MLRNIVRYITEVVTGALLLLVLLPWAVLPVLAVIALLKYLGS